MNGESVGELVFGTEACHMFAGEVCLVVKNDGIRKSKATTMFC